jgi:hypothetical protein
MTNTNIEVAACRRIGKSSGMKVVSIGYPLAIYEKSRSILRKHVILQEESTIVKEYSQTTANRVAAKPDKYLRKCIEFYRWSFVSYRTSFVDYVMSETHRRPSLTYKSKKKRCNIDPPVSITNSSEVRSVTNCLTTPSRGPRPCLSLYPFSASQTLSAWH